jgi:hypothetical protein
LPETQNQRGRVAGVIIFKKQARELEDNLSRAKCVQIPATTLKYFYRARVLQVVVTKLFETTWPQWRSLYKRH